MKDLRVIYDIGEGNEKLDIAIEKALKPLGFDYWASGYNFLSNKRDLAFVGSGMSEKLKIALRKAFKKRETK